MTEAPRWRLMAAHYLNVSQYQDGTKIEWEHKETNALNGRAVRKLFPVPLLLNPEDPHDYNYPGEIIVTQAVDDARCLPQDLVFTGAPTRDMEPLNAEAMAISDLHRARWTNPVETLPANGGMNSQEQEFMQSMMRAFAGQAANATVPAAQYDELKERLARLEAALAAQAKPVVESAVRRA